MKVTGIILAAGNSTRFGQNKNKNLFKINGKSVIEYSIDVLNNSKKIDDIILVIKEEEKSYFEEIVNNLTLYKPIKYVIGGKTRKASVYNAIMMTDANFVVIHDGARPNIVSKYIDASLNEMDKFKGTTIAVKSKDTIKICDSNQIVISTTNRANTWLIQTPQCFDRQILKAAHERFNENDESITDDCMLLENSGYDIKIIEGDYSNVKVTTYDDLNLVKIMK